MSPRWLLGLGATIGLWASTSTIMWAILDNLVAGAMAGAALTAYAVWDARRERTFVSASGC